MRYFLFTILCTASIMASGQAFDNVLRSIEANNTQLAALRSNNSATVAQLDNETSIMGPTSVEYSPFWDNGSGLASSELIVAQEFDFPTLGSMRRESNQAQGRVLDLQYQIARRDLLLEAKKLCYDLKGAMLTLELFNKREHTSDSLLVAMETNLKHGNATIIDVNRIKMDRMSVHTQAVTVQGNINTLLAQLQSLNGGKAVELGPDFVLQQENDLAPVETSLEESVAQASLNATAHEVKLAQKSWLPSFTVGYRRNGESSNAIRGFLVGVSMPLLGNGKKVKAAQARQQAVQAQIYDAHTQNENRTRELTTQAQQLTQAMKAYDMPLLQSTLALINKAIGAGALTVIEYYNQSDRIYDAMQALIDLDTQRNKVLADLHRQ